MWFNFNEYDNPQFAMLDKRAQKKEEEVYIGVFYSGSKGFFNIGF